jgi:hypothetical protein
MTVSMIESVSTEWSMHLKNMCKQTELYTSTHNPQTFSSEDEVSPVNFLKLLPKWLKQPCSLRQPTGIKISGQQVIA